MVADFDPWEYRQTSIRLSPEPPQATPAPRADPVDQETLGIVTALDETKAPEPIQMAVDGALGKELGLPGQSIRPKAVREGPL